MLKLISDVTDLAWCDTTVQCILWDSRLPLGSESYWTWSTLLWSQCVLFLCTNSDCNVVRRKSWLFVFFINCLLTKGQGNTAVWQTIVLLIGVILFKLVVGGHRGRFREHSQTYISLQNQMQLFLQNLSKLLRCLLFHELWQMLSDKMTVDTEDLLTCCL